MKVLFFAFCVSFTCCVSSTYIPPYYEGSPTSIRCVGVDPPDYRGEESYRIEFSLAAESQMPGQGFVHRTWEDFVKFDHLLTTHLLNFGLHFPSEPSVAALDEYLQRVLSHSMIVSSNMLSDLLGINWSGSDLKFLTSLPSFMQVVIPPLYRAPEFPPEPPVFETEMDAVTSEETPFEVWTYLMAFRSKEVINDYLAFFNNFLETCPSFSGPEDNSDVLPPGVTINYPKHFNKTFVHFLPGGYLNGHTARINYLGKSKFNFLDEGRLWEWLTLLHGTKRPKRILDIGTGPGFSAFVLGEIFPEAEGVAVDLSAPSIRWARKWAGLRNATNVQFYQATGEDLSWLEAESFDLINFAYVLHEMPAENAMNVVKAIHRLLRPGGVMNGFEIPFVENLVSRETYVVFNTWGHSWEDGSDHAQGPEPYMQEYQFGLTLTDTLSSVGFKNIEFTDYSYFEGIFIAEK